MPKGAKKEGSKLYDLTAEVFAVGKWNGLEFSESDLDQIAETFEALGDRHRVPLKLGHNDDQPMTDGQMALGWVEKVWREGQKLMARFVDLPDVLYNAIQQKRFRNVSIELDIGVKHKGRDYPYVLSGVAILGADIPAVNTLADLQAYLYSRGQAPEPRRATFTAIINESVPGAGREDHGKHEGNEMSMSDSEKAYLEKLENELREAKDKASAFEREKAEFQRKADEAAEKARKAEFSRKRDTMADRLDKMVGDKRITPATRDKFIKELSEDDEAVFNRVEYAVQALEEAGGVVTMNDGGEQGRQGQPGGDNTVPADEEVAKRAFKYQREHNMSYSKAVFAVLREDEDLARRYRDIGTDHLK